MAAAKPIVLIAGASSSGVYLASNLSTKYDVRLHNSGSDFRNDGVTNNLSLKAEGVPDASSIVAISTAPHPPALSQPWLNMYKLSDYADSFTSQSTNPIGAPHTVYVPKNYGGSEETDSGERIMPSQEIIAEYQSSLGTSAYSQILYNLNLLISFRSSTSATSGTYDSTSFAPERGLMIPNQTLKPGQVALMQAAFSWLAYNLGYEFTQQFTNQLNYLPTFDSRGATTQNFTIDNAGATISPIKSASKTSYTIGPTQGSGSSYYPNTLFLTGNKEYSLDQYRNRSTFSRITGNTFRQPCNIRPAPYNSKGWINTTTMNGNPGFTIGIYLNDPVKRIVFKTIPGVAPGQDYWLQNYPVANILKSNFVKPLTVIGYETGSSMATKVFHPCDHAVLSAGVFGNVALLYQSGIGPASDLAALGIPCLLNLPVGQKVSSRVGFKMLITALNSKIGTVDPGTYSPMAVIDGAAADIAKQRRRVYINFNQEPGVNKYSAEVILHRPRSMGTVKGTSNWSPTSLPAVSFTPNYFTVSEDSDDIAYAVKKIASAFYSLDNTVTFQNPNMTYAAIQSATSSALISSLATNPANFIVKGEYFGGTSPGLVDASLNPNPVTLVNGKIKGTNNLRVLSSSATPFVKDIANGVNVMIPAADGDQTLNDMLYALYLNQLMMASLS